MTTNNHNQHVSFLLVCYALHHLIRLDVERETDITTTMGEDPTDMTIAPYGLAIYRERTLIECPMCKSMGILASHMRVLPGSVTTRIKFTPDDKSTI